MSKMLCAVLSCICVLILGVCSIQCMKHKTRLAKYISLLLIVNTLSVAGYTLIFFSHTYRGMSIGNSIFLAGADWLCYATLLYTVEYTKYKDKPILPYNRWLQVLVILIFVADSISMLCNAVYEHALRYQVIYYKGEQYLRLIPQPLYYVHLLIECVAFVVSMGIFIYKGYKAPQIYKKKYSFIIFTYIGVALITAIFFISRPVFDISAYVYAIASCLVYYFMFYYGPRYLEEIMQKLGRNKQKDLLIMFDDEDKCIYMNDNMSQILNGYKCERDYFENFWNYENPSCKTAVLTTDGDKIIYTKEYEQLVDNKGRYMGCFYVMHDITKERERVPHEPIARHRLPCHGRRKCEPLRLEQARRRDRWQNAHRTRAGDCAAGGICPRDRRYAVRRGPRPRKALWLSGFGQPVSRMGREPHHQTRHRGHGGL